MYHGKMTKELDVLYDQYYDRFGVDPDFHMELDYSDRTEEDYKEYVNDIKLALSEGKSLPELHPEEGDDDFEEE